MDYAITFDQARQICQSELEEAQSCLSTFLSKSETNDFVAKMATECANALRNGGRVLTAGNGGSLCDAMHFAEELTGRYKGDRKPLAAIALSDPSHMSCTANDFGFDHVFSRMVEAYGRPGDVLILLSTSGNSQNLVLAVEKAHECSVKTYALLGKSGGKLSGLAENSLIAPGAMSDRIQELHMIVLHITVGLIEKLLGLA